MLLRHRLRKQLSLRPAEFMTLLHYPLPNAFSASSARGFAAVRFPRCRRDRGTARGSRPDPAPVAPTRPNSSRVPREDSSRSSRGCAGARAVGVKERRAERGRIMRDDRVGRLAAPARSTSLRAANRSGVRRRPVVFSTRSWPPPSVGGSVNADGFSRG